VPAQGQGLSRLEEIFDPFLCVDPTTSAVADPSVWFLPNTCIPAPVIDSAMLCSDPVAGTGHSSHRLQKGILMSFTGGQIPINNEVSRAKVVEAEADAARYARLHGGDIDPRPPGKARRGLQWLRSMLGRQRAK
jgi:hypothetical protein